MTGKKEVKITTKTYKPPMLSIIILLITSLMLIFLPLYFNKPLPIIKQYGDYLFILIGILVFVYMLDQLITFITFKNGIEIEVSTSINIDNQLINLFLNEFENIKIKKIYIMPSFLTNYIAFQINNDKNLIISINKSTGTHYLLSKKSVIYLKDVERFILNYGRVKS
jgi:hypothetical protein